MRRPVLLSVVPVLCGALLSGIPAARAAVEKLASAAAIYFLPGAQGFLGAQGLAGAPLTDTGFTFIVVPLPKT
jgi:hypothetical protein